MRTQHPGTNVGGRVVAIDPDRDVLRYSLTGSGSGLFTVSATGQISVATGAALDHETTDSYALTLTAMDPSGLTATATVTIAVEDVNEAPALALSTYIRTVSIRAQADDTVGVAIVATDPDNGDVLSLLAQSGDQRRCFHVCPARDRLPSATAGW